MNDFEYRNGCLFVEDVAVADLAREMPTPFYVYSARGIVDRFNAFDGAAKRHLKKSLTCFAIKSNANPAIIRLLANCGAGADIVSGGELALALKCGVPAGKIVFSGVGKTREELTAAVDAGIKQINVESAEEAEMLNEIAVAAGKKVDVALRVNPDVDAHTHAKITTGKKENKFGVDWKKARELYRFMAGAQGLNPVGIDVHVGSQLLELRPFAEAFERAVEIVKVLRSDGIAVRTIDVGGGLGVAYRDTETPPEPEEYMALAEKILGPLDCEIVFEPGRYLVAQAGGLVARVVRVKNADTKRFLVLDAGMNDLIRPAIYDAFHDIVPLRQGEKSAVYDVVGPICESSDVFGKDRAFPEMRADDFVLIKTAGAYGSSMGSTYNFRPLCAEVLVQGDKHAVIRERQTLDDMLALTRDAPWL